MKIQEIGPVYRKSARRVGRGTGSGLGKTSGKGHKGQKARAGSGKGAGFEGGQMPLHRRVPKRGFTNIFKIGYKVLNLKDIAALDTDTVTLDLLVERGMIKSLREPVKVLGDGELTRALTVKANAFSASAARKIKEAGGAAEVV